MPRPDEPAYWEDFARGIGWGEEQVKEAGEVGSLAVARGMNPSDAMDVVIARIRDGKDVRIGPQPLARWMSNQGVPAFACGAVAFVAAGVGKQGFSVAHMYPLLFSGLLALEIFLVIKGLTTRGWKLALLGLAMTIGALWVALVPIPSFSS